MLMYSRSFSTATTATVIVVALVHRLLYMQRTGQYKIRIFQSVSCKNGVMHQTPYAKRKMLISRCTWSVTVGHKKILFFSITQDKYWPIFVIFFTTIYNKELRNKNLLKFSPHLKSVGVLLCETWNVKCVQCESKTIPPPEIFWHFFPNDWEF